MTETPKEPTPARGIAGTVQFGTSRDKHEKQREAPPQPRWDAIQSLLTRFRGDVMKGPGSDWVKRWSNHCH